MALFALSSSYHCTIPCSSFILYVIGVNEEVVPVQVSVTIITDSYSLKYNQIGSSLHFDKRLFSTYITVVCNNWMLDSSSYSCRTQVIEVLPAGHLFNQFGIIPKVIRRLARNLVNP